MAQADSAFITDASADAKRCPKCEQDRPFHEFGRCRTRKDGLQCYCRGCVKADYKANAPERNARARAYYARNRTIILQQKQEYQSLKAEKIRAAKAAS